MLFFIPGSQISYISFHVCVNFLIYLWYITSSNIIFREHNKCLYLLGLLILFMFIYIVMFYTNTLIFNQTSPVMNENSLWEKYQYNMNNLKINLDYLCCWLAAWSFVVQLVFSVLSLLQKFKFNQSFQPKMNRLNWKIILQILVEW